MTIDNRVYQLGEVNYNKFLETKRIIVESSGFSIPKEQISSKLFPLIERALQLWTNPGDIVLDPFDGIGSTGYVAIKAGRRHIGIELKRSYWDQAVKNLQRAETETKQFTLFEEL